MNKPLCILSLLILGILAIAEYKPNGPPLHTCVGAIPMEPNTDKLEQSYFTFTNWKMNVPFYVMATTKEEFANGVRFLDENDAKRCEFKENHLHIFFYNGKVEARNTDANLLGLLMEVQVFGIERMYVKDKADVVTVHITSMDVGKERPMAEHAPGIFYSIPFDKLDTESDKTPKVTDKTQFVLNYMNIVSNHPVGKNSPIRKD